MNRRQIVATVTAKDLETSDPLVTAINRAILSVTGETVEIRLDRSFCIGNFMCGSEISKMNNPLILNDPISKPAVRKHPNEMGDRVEFAIWV